jgi:hypothetical protein
MGLLKHTYSGLITNGLLMPACCGLLTMGFGLFKCKIEIINPPIIPGGGGGGIGTVSGLNIQRPSYIPRKTKVVQITVNFTKDSIWRKSYIIGERKADIFVKVFNIVNSITSKITITVKKLQSATRKITAVFKNTDK